MDVDSERVEVLDVVATETGTVEPRRTALGFQITLTCPQCRATITGVVADPDMSRVMDLLKPLKAN